MAFPFLTDLGLVAFLLMLSFFIRYLIRPLQQLFIPISVIGGLLILLLGNNGFQVLPFSTYATSYPGIFICFIFAAIPFSFAQNKGTDAPKRNRKSIIQVMYYFGIILFLQWGVGMLFGLTILKWIFPELHNGFGGLIATGFFGGHGTAAAISESFASSLNWEDIGSLAMTSATVGILSATVGGILLIQWGIKNEKTKFIKTLDQMPREFKTGVIPEIRQSSMGNKTFSSVAVDPLLMHFLLILLLGFAAYWLAKYSALVFNGYSIAGFSIAFFLGLLTKWIFEKTGAIEYFDSAIMSRICGVFTDLLVAFGIGSIRIEVVVDYAWPLLLLFLVGVALSYYCFRRLSEMTFARMWFENSIFTWGWITGISAMGIALLRMVDPDSDSDALQNFAIAYLAVTPFEVLFLVFFPFFIGQGWHWLFTLGCLAIGGVLLLLMRRGYLRPLTN